MQKGEVEALTVSSRDPGIQPPSPMVGTEIRYFEVAVNEGFVSFVYYTLQVVGAVREDEKKKVTVVSRLRVG